MARTPYSDKTEPDYTLQDKAHSAARDLYNNEQDKLGQKFTADSSAPGGVVRSQAEGRQWAPGERQSEMVKNARRVAPTKREFFGRLTNPTSTKEQGRMRDLVARPTGASDNPEYNNNTRWGVHGSDEEVTKAIKTGWKENKREAKATKRAGAEGVSPKKAAKIKGRAVGKSTAGKQQREVAKSYGKAGKSYTKKFKG